MTRATPGTGPLAGGGHAEAAGSAREPRARRLVERALGRADVRLDGARPWDIHVRDRRLFARTLRHGVTGLADAYADGWWECDAIDELMARSLRADVPATLRWTPHAILSVLRHRLVNLQSRARAGPNGRHHYDRGNDLFQAMLDPTMSYSCGYWSGGAQTLEQAQEAKLELICRKLGLGPGMLLLDIGCGWGGLVRWAAERHGARCTGVTVSGEQLDLARERCAGLPVEIQLRDYREIEGRFDRVASVGMFEHVGQKNHRAFMRALDRALADDGLALVHFFASPRSFPNRRDLEVDWFERRIFPGMVIPSMAQVGRAIDGLFVIEDVHNFGADYDPTLMAWHARFQAAWPTLRASGRYDERFRRAWRFYLLGAAGAFRSRKYQLWQVVLSKRGVAGGYTSVRSASHG